MYANYDSIIRGTLYNIVRIVDSNFFFFIFFFKFAGLNNHYYFHLLILSLASKVQLTLDNSPLPRIRHAANYRESTVMTYLRFTNYCKVSHQYSNIIMYTDSSLNIDNI